MQAAVAIGKRVHVDKAEADDGGAHRCGQLLTADSETAQTRNEREHQRGGRDRRSVPSPGKPGRVWPT